ncbi:MAG TPA: phosphate ABC transporter permease PstA, partial [Chloroflexota bacterium]|nr:phosphate ABC transporter permease PstA [Chloroflexota bacterium]
MPAASSAADLHPRASGRAVTGRAFHALCLAATTMGMLMLLVLLADVIVRGAGTLNWTFLTSFPSRNASGAGIKSALAGTLWLISLTAAFAIPTGIAAAIWLEEYPSRGRLSRIIEININNLAGVPSIIYGLLGLGLFVRFLFLGRSILAGALTMALLVLPVIIINAREALRAVPSSQRDAAYALGATRSQVVGKAVLPVALPGIFTGVILALSRAIGETAPLITIGAL